MPSKSFDAEMLLFCMYCVPFFECLVSSPLACSKTNTLPREKNAMKFIAVEITKAWMMLGKFVYSLWSAVVYTTTSGQYWS